MRLSVLSVPLVLLVACDAERDIALTFDARVGDVPAACGTPLTGLGTGSTSGELADARFFASSVQLHRTGGDWVDLALADSDWQGDGIVLLDFEDGTAGCADSGTSETNAMIEGLAPGGDYDGLRFDVGVPFALNHVDAATAPTPRNAPGMFWVWQGGYKFLRVDLIVDGGEVPRWNMHIGSTGCASAAPTEAPTDACERPNLATVELLDLDLTGVDTIDLDLGALVAAADVAADTPDSPPGCMSSPTEPSECGPVFGALGLDFADGTCVDGCAAQAVFRAGE